MSANTKKAIIAGASFVAFVVLYNLLPKGTQMVSTITAAAGFVAGIVAKVWYDRQVDKNEEAE